MKEKSFYAICPECQDNMQVMIVGNDVYLKCYHYQFYCGHKENNSLLSVSGCDACFLPVIMNLSLLGSACSNPACPHYKIEKDDSSFKITYNNFRVFEILEYEDKLYIGVFTNGTTGKPETLQFFKDLFLKILEANGISVNSYLDLPVKEISPRSSY